MKVKLESFLQEISEKTTENDQHPVLTSSKAGLFLQRDYFNKQVASKDNTGYKIIRRGQFTYRAMSDTGEFFPNMLECTDIGIVSPAYPVFEITKQGVVVPEFLKYFFKSDSFQHSIAAFAQGSTRTSVKFGKMKTVEITLPSVPEQRHIVEVLDRAKTVIEVREQELQKLDELVNARFVELFGNPVINNKGWNVSDLGQLTIKIGSGATPKGGKEAYQTDGISLIRSMNVHNGKFEYKELAHISDEQAARLENVAIEENDVLLNITGASVARSCVVPTNVLPARVNQHVCIIRCKDSIMPDFINSLLIDDNYQDLLWSIAGSGATREAITKQQVESLQIILPPISKQEEFSKFINRVDKSKFLQFFCFPI